MIVDVHNLTQHGMNFITIFVPKVHKLLLQLLKGLSIVTGYTQHCCNDLLVLYISVLDSSFSMLTRVYKKWKIWITRVEGLVFACLVVIIRY